MSELRSGDLQREQLDVRDIRQTTHEIVKIYSKKTEESNVDIAVDEKEAQGGHDEMMRWGGTQPSVVLADWISVGIREARSECYAATAECGIYTDDIQLAGFGELSAASCQTRPFPAGFGELSAASCQTRHLPAGFGELSAASCRTRPKARETDQVVSLSPAARVRGY